MAVTPNIASQLILFGVGENKMRVILKDDEFEGFEFVKDALTKKIEIETVISSKSFPDPPFAEAMIVDADKNMRSLRVLSLFSGCGGLDRGLAGADGKGGFKTKWAIDVNATSIETFKAYMPSTQTYALDVGDMLEKIHILPGMLKKGEVDVILIGTPCKPFSFLISNIKNKPRNLNILT